MTMYRDEVETLREELKTARAELAKLQQERPEYEIAWDQVDPVMTGIVFVVLLVALVVFVANADAASEKTWTTRATAYAIAAALSGATLAWIGWSSLPRRRVRR